MTKGKTPAQIGQKYIEGKMEMIGDEADTVLEESGVAFDPTSQHLDLSKEEKRRTTALMLAIQAYQHLIIKEADYLREASSLARSGDGPALKPATIDAMVDAAWKFDEFISGRIQEALLAAAQEHADEDHVESSQAAAAVES